MSGFRSAQINVARTRAPFALRWVPAAHLPGVEEGEERRHRLQAAGPSEYAFTFKQRFPPRAEFLRRRA